MRITVYLLLLTLLTGCLEASLIKEESNKSILKNPIQNESGSAGKQKMLSQIVSDTSRINLLSWSKKDTSVLNLSYQHFLFDNVSKKAAYPYQDSVNHEIVKYVSIITSFESFDENAVISEEFFDLRLKEFANYYESDSDDESTVLWSFEASIGIDNSYNYFCQVSTSNWSYTGGAHGNGHSTYFIKDKESGSSLDLNDFISDVDELNVIAEIEFREELNLIPTASLDEEGFWFDNGKFVVNDNFYFGDDSLNFLFNTYEIAPYSAGSIQFAIPIKKIEHLLKIKAEK